MKLVVTTSKSVLAIDIVTGHASVLHRGAGLYYGICQAGGDLLIAARRRSITSETPIENERGCLISFSVIGELSVIESPFFLRDMHGICCYKDSVFVTCTYDEKVAIYQDGHWTEWFPLGKISQSPCDRHHINTIVFDKELIHIVYHNFGQSYIVSFDPITRAPQQQLFLGHSAHNVWFDDEEIRTCSSGEGRLVGADRFSLATGSYPRGYACDATARVVGLTQVATRNARDTVSGGLLVMDDAYRKRHEIWLAEEGMVLDLHALSEARFEALGTGRETVHFELFECGAMPRP